MSGVFDLTGRVALVTGAGQGVGAGIARRLAAQGAAVAVNDIDPERAKQSAESIAKEGGRALACPFDVIDPEAVAAAVARIEDELGPVDILVNNAGVPPGMALAPFRTTAHDDWKPFIDLNVYGVLHCTRAVIDGMCTRGFGRVITISSGAGTGGAGIGVAAYGAAKGGGLAFSRNLALEVAREGVTVNGVALGLMNNVPEEAVASMARTVPAGRLGDPDDVGACCVYLASDEAAWMTGQTLQLNGGSITT